MKAFTFTILLGFLLASFPDSVKGQEKCGTMEHYAMRKAADPTLEAKMQAEEQAIQKYILAASSASGAKKAIVTIPVVVHVVYANAAQNVPDAQIFAQIDVLNEDFRRMNADTGDTPDVWKGIAADLEVEFCLAVRDPDGNPTDGITRTATTETSFSTNNDMKFDATGGKDSWNTSQYLNMWVCNLSGSTVGYAEFPSGGFSNTWGVVITYWGFGKGGVSSYPYDIGRTGVHEVGHAFNLRHIWGDDGNSCAGSDNVADTPDQEGSTGGCPSHPALDNCSPAAPGYMFNNYMDYTNDYCINMFTEGQKARFQATLNGSKSSLKSSLGCIPPNALDASITLSTSMDTACGTNAFYPNITLFNVGTDVLTSVDIYYRIDNEAFDTYAWTGSLASLTSEQVILPPIVAAAGTHTLSIYSSNPNGGTDGYLFNDSVQSDFSFVEGNPATLTLDLGDFQIAQFLSWDVIDSAGNSIDSSGGYEKNTSYTEAICLPNGCYTFNIHNPPDNALGSFSLTNAQGANIGSGNTLTDTSFNFCVTLAPPIDTTSIADFEVGILDLKVYPNPFSDQTTIKFKNPTHESLTLSLFDIQGRVLRTIANITSEEVIVERGDLESGVYFLKLTSSGAPLGLGKMVIE